MKCSSAHSNIRAKRFPALFANRSITHADSTSTTNVATMVSNTSIANISVDVDTAIPYSTTTTSNTLPPIETSTSVEKLILPDDNDLRRRIAELIKNLGVNEAFNTQELQMAASALKLKGFNPFTLDEE